jgi:hypothetical protein
VFSSYLGLEDEQNSEIQWFWVLYTIVLIFYFLLHFCSTQSGVGYSSFESSTLLLIVWNKIYFFFIYFFYFFSYYLMTISISRVSRVGAFIWKPFARKRRWHSLSTITEFAPQNLSQESWRPVRNSKQAPTSIFFACYLMTTSISRVSRVGAFIWKPFASKRPWHSLSTITEFAPQNLSQESWCPFRNSKRAPTSITFSDDAPKICNSQIFLYHESLTVWIIFDGPHKI